MTAPVEAPHEVRLAVTPPVTWAPALRALAAHSVPGLAETDLATGRHTRTLATPAGPARVTVTLVDGAADVPCAVTLPDGGDLEAVVGRVRRWLDLDHDPGPVDAHLAADPRAGARWWGPAPGSGWSGRRTAGRPR